LHYRKWFHNYRFLGNSTMSKLFSALAAVLLFASVSFADSYILGTSVAAGGGVLGSGTTNTVAKFTASGTIGDSSLSDSGTAVTSTVPLIVPGGAAANTGLASTTGGVSTGIWWPSSGRMILTSAGSTRVDITASGVSVLGTFFPGADDAVNLGLSATRFRDAMLSSSIRIGTNPASAGAVRLANTATISARNAANNGNVTIATVNASDQPVFGAGVTQTCDAAGDITVVGGIITACTAP
jgi:hypothetical protein